MKKALLALLVSLSHVHAGRPNTELIEENKKNIVELVGLIINKSNSDFIKKKCKSISDININVPFEVEHFIFKASPLVAALFTNNPSIVETILANPNTDPNIQEAYNKETPFHIMIRHCSHLDKIPEIMKLFLSHPLININAKNKEGATPLMVANEYLDFRTINLLFKHGVDETLLDKNGHSALDYRPETTHRVMAQNPLFEQILEEEEEEENEMPRGSLSVTPILEEIEHFYGNESII